MNLRNKSIIVTGAGRGLGRALSIQLAERGARVVLVARNRENVETVASEIRSAGGVAFAIAADISDKGAIYPLAGQAAALAGPVDIVINNASTLGPVPLRPLADTDCEDFEAALQTNLLGPFRLTKAVVGSMAVRHAGLVVNISSDAAVEAYPEWGAYSATKAALDHLTRIWAAELEGSGVRFFSFDPGEMDTKMHADAIPSADPASLSRPADVAAALVRKIENHEALPSGARLKAKE